MPQRSQFATIPGTSSPFGPSIFSSWNPTVLGRERGSTLASIASVGSNGPSSPAQSQFSKEGSGESDVHMRTLDYLGLAETPQQPRAQLATPYMSNMGYAKQNSRFRSYSVNNKDKYADEEEYGEANSQYVAALQGQLAATQAAIHNHNLAVHAFINQASVPRPRAHTAGVLDTPGNRLTRSYLAGNVSVPIPPGDAHLQENKDYDELPHAIANMGLGMSNSHNPGLLSAEEQGPEGPTSALWLGSIPTSTTTSTLTEMFKPHGRVLSARVLTNKSCGFVNFERVESAISAKASMNGKEIFPGGGPIRINFAKPASASNTPGHDGLYPSPSPDPFAASQDGTTSSAVTAAGDATPAVAAVAVTPTVPPLHDMDGDIIDMVVQFGASEDDKLQIVESVKSAIQFTSFVDETSPVPEASPNRIFDAPRLRDIRKRIEIHTMPQAEAERHAVEIVPEVAELSADYLGNTVVQRLLECCGDEYRDPMLQEILPIMPDIGVHKNGTWVAQKILEVCKTPSQISSIVEHLRPYTVPLLLDQYGNYVVQGCLKFGRPYSDFVFETMMSRMWEIAQGRYGARAMRTCLESHHTTRNQQRMMAACIALHSVQLSTNSNGALVLTWFLDCCTFPQRRTVLANLLTPHLVYLCTHKVAYMTILKIVNQKSEPEARDTILKALFFSPNDQILEAILKDPSSGATLIFKVLTTPCFDEPMRSQVVETVKSLLVKIQAHPSQGYKRLMDEVGLSTRPSTAGNRDPNIHSDQRQRPTSRHMNGNGQQSQGAQGNKPFYNSMQSSSSSGSYDMAYGPGRGEARGTSSAAFSPYNQPIMYSGSNEQMHQAIPVDHYQYQQSMMGRGGPPPVHYEYNAMQSGYGGYGPANPSMGQMPQQNMPNGNSVHQPAMSVQQMPGAQAGFAPPGFGMSMVGYAYGGMGAMGPNMGYMQQQGRGHVSGHQLCANTDCNCSSYQQQ